ncbi:VOC family protein [Arthrobacter sp. HLT1-20]
MSERTVPILSCQNLDDVLAFYEALGFEKTYRQERPNPYLCLKRGSIDIHFSAVAAFEPENSLGSIIILTPDTGHLFEQFATGLKEHFGKLPISGIPRITRPRRRQGTAGGFTVVDPGGNWLRIVSSAQDQQNGPTGVFERVMLNAARQGDARGDIPVAISVLDAGLLRHADAPQPEKVPVLAYLAELLVRAGYKDRARTVLAELAAMELSSAEKAALSADLATAAELGAEL